MQYSTSPIQGKDGYTIIRHRWLPKGDTPAHHVLLIHGMAEHAKRYHYFAEFLTENGIAVHALDLRGHGATANMSGQFGHISKKDGWRKLVSDNLCLFNSIKTEHDGSSVVILGHSMGSFIAQHCAMLVSKQLDGLILSGTSMESRGALFPGLIVTKFASLFGLGDQPANWLQHMIFSGYNKSFKPARTDFDWLSSDPASVDAYIDDPWCGFTCSYQFFHDLFTGLWHLTPKNIGAISPSLPVLIFGGSQDPMGNLGSQIGNLFKVYESHGFKQIQSKLYLKSRHEIFNDQERHDAFSDVLDWLNSL